MTSTFFRPLAAAAIFALGLVLAPAAARADEEVVSGSWKMTLPRGLQKDAAFVPENNPVSDAKIELGRDLYFDTRLSKDDTVSCATCHAPEHGFAEPRKTSQGVGGKVGKRNAPTVINRLFSSNQFWDGRADDLEAQAKGPITNPIEMAMDSPEAVVKKLSAIPGYKALFAKAFGSDEVSMQRIADAIAAYERTVVSGDSPYDRYQAGDKKALTAQQLRGLELFNGKANCATCHASFNFSDENFHNLGVGWDESKKELADVGRFEVSKADTDKGAFKTPTLRNITQTGPYMHDGSEATLREVVVLYNRGGNKNPWLSPKMKPLGLTEPEIDDLVAFLGALDGEVKAPGKPATFPQ
ncbi:MAG: cytochrome-c peroxidase [Alphaproteobacteria bacterium]